MTTIMLLFVFNLHHLEGAADYNKEFILIISSNITAVELVTTRCGYLL